MTVAFLANGVADSHSDRFPLNSYNLPTAVLGNLLFCVKYMNVFITLNYVCHTDTRLHFHLYVRWIYTHLYIYIVWMCIFSNETCQVLNILFLARSRKLEWPLEQRNLWLRIMRSSSHVEDECDLRVTIHRKTTHFVTWYKSLRFMPFFSIYRAGVCYVKLTEENKLTSDFLY